MMFRIRRAAALRRRRRTRDRGVDRARRRRPAARAAAPARRRAGDRRDQRPLRRRRRRRDPDQPAAGAARRATRCTSSASSSTTPSPARVPVDFTAIGLYNAADRSPARRSRRSRSGTHVNSYLLHSDPPGTTDGARAPCRDDRLHHRRPRRAGARRARSTERAVDCSCTRPGTTYPNGDLGPRALGATGNGDYARLINRRTVVGLVQDVDRGRRDPRDHQGDDEHGHRRSRATGCSPPTVASSTSAASSSTARPVAGC